MRRTYLEHNGNVTVVHYPTAPAPAKPRGLHCGKCKLDLDACTCAFRRKAQPSEG